MEALEVGARVFKLADRHGKNIRDLLARPDYGTSASDVSVMAYEMTMMTTYWQMAVNLSKDLTDPLKSIVNK